MLNTPNTFMQKIYWLNQNKPIGELSNLQLQKFCFFYEMFQLIEDNKYDLSYLRAYANGPVYSNVYGDYTHRKEQFFFDVSSNSPNMDQLCDENLRKSLFLITTLNNRELSDLTHNLDLWKSKKNRIRAGEQQIPIYERDITDYDKSLLASIRDGIDASDNYEVVPISDKRFVLDLESFSKLETKHYEVLEQLSQLDELDNPVYIEIDDRGTLLVD